MRILLSATLAVLLVAAVTAQSSKQAEHETSIQSIISNINLVIDSLGGFEGAIDKLTYISKLVTKAYEDDGIGGWMARSLIKMELNELKKKAQEAEKQIINKLLDELEAKIGLKSTTYSAVSAVSAVSVEKYVFSEAVTKAIATIRQSIQEIVREINQAQKEHDAAATIITGDVKNKLTEHIANLKEKLLGLSKKLMDKLTGRDRTAEVYSAKVAVSRQMLQARSDGNNVLSGMIRVAKEQLRERIFKFIEVIGEAKRQVVKAFGENKKLVMQHIKLIEARLEESMTRLQNILLGTATAEEVQAEIEQEEQEETNVQTYTVQKMSARTYVIDSLVKQMIEQLRPKILEIIEQIGAAKREVGKAIGENKELALKHLAELKEKLRRFRRDLWDALRGKKTADELEKDLEEKL